MADRTVLHCDLNNFFASVSLLFNPTLKNMPVAVCGDKESRHGIVLAKNEIAKKFGVKTAEAIFEAKTKCPELVILPPIYEKYCEYSSAVHRIYERYTDIIEPFGIDECWLDVTGSNILFGDGEKIANLIRNDVKKELGLTVSVGVSFNKVFAKLGSDMKKPDAVTVISRENFKEKIWQLPVNDLLFVGKSSYERLKSVGVHTIGDLSLCSDSTLKRLLGKNGVLLKSYALGDDTSPVLTPTDDDKPKSIGKSTTGAKDFTKPEEVRKEFLKFAEYICFELHSKNLFASGVQVHIRDSSLEVKEFSRNFAEPTNSPLILTKRAFELFSENCDLKEPLRSVGIRAINIKDSVYSVQQSIFSSDNEEAARIEKVDNSLFDLRQKFGKSSIKRGRII